MAVTTLNSTGAGAIWNQWTPTGSTYSTEGNVANKQSFVFDDPTGVLDSSATITKVVLTVTWATAAAGNAILINGVWPDFTITNGGATTAASAGAVTTTVELTPPSAHSPWSISELAAMEIQVYASAPATSSAALMSVIVGSGMYLTVTDTSVVPPGTESESILLIL